MTASHKKFSVAVLFGGPSEEHNVSLVSAKNLAQALEQSDFSVVCVGIERKSSQDSKDSPQWRRMDMEDLQKTSFEAPIDISTLGQTTSPQEVAQQVDCVFPICHGPFGEDGQLQEQLEKLKIPYVGTSCLLYTSPSPRDGLLSRMPSSA